MTDPTTRQQRRRLEREQLKSGRALLAAGLPPTPKREAMRDVARTLAHQLGDETNPHRASEAAASAQTLFETSLKRFPARVEVACRKGCGYCCSAFVGAVPPEIFRMARSLTQALPAGVTRQGIETAAAQLHSMPPEARVGARLACPLLVDNVCSAYTYRPLVCRQATSLSLAACIEEYEGTTSASDQIEVSSAHLTHAGNAHLALLGAMLAVGMPIRAYEFASALALVLRTPDAERRWLAGENIFAGLPDLAKRQPVIDQIAAKIAADLSS